MNQFVGFVSDKLQGEHTHDHPERKRFEATIGVKGLITINECYNVCHNVSHYCCIRSNWCIIYTTKKRHYFSWLFVTQPGLGVAFILYLAGRSTTPNLPSKLGRECPGGTARVKRCRIQDKKRKSSIFAKASPRHTLMPVPKGR